MFGQERLKTALEQLDHSKLETTQAREEVGNLEMLLEESTEQGDVLQKELKLQADLNTTVASRDKSMTARANEMSSQLKALERDHATQVEEYEAKIGSLKEEVEVDR